MTVTAAVVVVHLVPHALTFTSDVHTNFSFTVSPTAFLVQQFTLTSLYILMIKD